MIQSNSSKTKLVNCFPDMWDYNLMLQRKYLWAGSRHIWPCSGLSHIPGTWHWRGLLPEIQPLASSICMAYLHGVTMCLKVISVRSTQTTLLISSLFLNYGKEAFLFTCFLLLNFTLQNSLRCMHVLFPCILHQILSFMRADIFVYLIWTLSSLYLKHHLVLSMMGNTCWINTWTHAQAWFSKPF